MTKMQPVTGEKVGQSELMAAYWITQRVPIVYVNMPKSGCTTIKNVLHRLNTGQFLDDPLTIHARKDLFLRAPDDADEIGRRLQDCLVFTFVRHPLKRAYSCFNEKIHFTSKYGFGKVRDCCVADYGARFVDAPEIELHRQNFKAFLRFATDSMEGRNGWRRDPHWCPQSRALNRVRRWRMVDFVGRVERFDEHLKAILNLAGIAYDFETPRMNEGPKPPYAYDSIVDDEVLSLGEALYQSDFRHFGYAP